MSKQKKPSEQTKIFLSNSSLVAQIRELGAKEADAKNRPNPYGYDPEDLQRVMMVHLSQEQEWSLFLDSQIERTRKSGDRAKNAIKYSNYGVAGILAGIPGASLAIGPILDMVKDNSTNDSQVIWKNSLSTAQLLLGGIIAIIKYVCEPISQVATEAENRLVALKKWGMDHPGWQKGLTSGADDVHISINEPINSFLIHSEGEGRAFLEYDVPADGDCGFSALGVSRANAVQMLKEIKDQAKKKRVVEELIESVVNYKTAPADNEDVTRYMAPPLQGEINGAIDGLIVLQRNRINAREALRTALRERDIALDATNSDEAIFDHVKRNTENVREIPQAQKEALVQTERAYLECLDNIQRNQQFFDAYVESYTHEKGIWLGTQTMRVLAEIQGKGLTIWAPDRNTVLSKIPPVVNPSDPENEMVHVLLRGNHYTKLKAGPLPQSSPAPRRSASSSAQGSVAVKPVSAAKKAGPERSPVKPASVAPSADKARSSKQGSAPASSQKTRPSNQLSPSRSSASTFHPTNSRAPRRQSNAPATRPPLKGASGQPAAVSMSRRSAS